MIDVRLLGPPGATVDGEPAPPELMWRKHFALLAYLALAPDRRASRSQLAGLLWGDKPEKSARGSLAEALRIIRSCADGGLEDTGADFVRLTDGAVETDTDRFSALVEAGEHVAAAELVRGELLEGLAVPDAWEFEEWLAGQRRSWRARSERALLAGADEALAGGSPATAYDLAQRALLLVPTSNAACRTAMRCLCLRGDRGGALELYDSFRTHLDEELGIDPEEETDALADRVRSQRRWRLPEDRAARPPRGAESRRAPLVGRAEELRGLIGEWQTCLRAGSPRVAVISGDLGTGRTRLLDEALARARLDGAATAVVRAVPADRTADGSVLEALTRTAGIEPGLQGAELEAALNRVTDETPLILAIDDAGWADERSLTELERVAVRGGDVRVMVILVTARRTGRETLDRLSAELGRKVPGVLVRLAPLDDRALRELTAWAVPTYDKDALDRLARRVAADTAGHPLLAVELLHAVAHGLTLGSEPETWPMTGRTLDQTRPAELPDTLVASIRVGFRVLTDEAQQVLAAASVLEAPTGPDRLAAGTQLGEETLEEALDELEWEHWLVADARGYDFVAPLVREVIARDMVTEGQKRRILASA